MSRSVVVALAFLLSMPVQARSEASGWFASARCFVYREIGSGNFDDVTDVAINAIFDGERYLRKPLPEGASAIDMLRNYLQIQIVPPFPSWYILKGKRFAVAMGGESTVDLVRNTSFDSDPRPRFDFVGDGAEELSRKLANGKEVKLIIQYDPNNKTTVSLTSAQILTGWAKFESCISGVYRDKEQ